MPGARKNEGASDLAPYGMRNSDYDYLGNRGMSGKCRLDFPRKHVLSAGDVHLLSPPANSVKAIAIACCEVTGTQPSTRSERFSRAIFVMEITAEHLRATKQQLARLPFINVIAALGNETHLEKWHRSANSARITK